METAKIISIRPKVSALYVRTQAAIRSGKKIIIHRGGTRSGKTVSNIQNALHWLINPYEEAAVWTVVRKTLPALKATAYRDFLSELHTLPDEIQNAIEHNKTELTFTLDGKMVEFFSLDDPQKIRSRKRKHLHIVEANEIDFEETFTQLVLRTTGSVLLDFNPDDPNVWIRTELEEKRASMRGDVEVIVSTYKDNPFLSQREIDEIEYLRESSPQAWEVFGLGNYGKISGQVFQHVEVIDAFPDDIRTTYFGIDFGFAVDPTAVVRVGIVNDRLYLDEVLYDRSLNNKQLADRLDKRGQYVADSAEPKSIDELQRYGLSVVASLKGPDSIRAGVQRWLQFKTFVTGRSTNLLKELRVYRQDDQGYFSDRMNHAIDATRYVIQTKLRPNNSFGPITRATNFNRVVG